ncbi:MAG: GNAT family N-acetyltransferase [Saprospiraceae bacterium]|nr:GNAT family N-acetyltransferase [Saprospiraceae bacterium]
MYIHQIEFATPEYDRTIQLRTEVLRKPLNLEFTLEQLEEEYNQVHFGGFLYDGNLVGCLVLQPLDQVHIKMRQVAVLPELQSKGIGQKLVAHAELFAKSNGYKKITLNARDTATKFYEKLNYKIVGEPFEEVSIIHYKMKKNI